MLTRLYILLSLILALLLTLLITNFTTYRPANPTPIAIYHSPYPVITPDNANRLTPVAVLSQGGDNYSNALRRPVWSPDGYYLGTIDSGGENDLRSPGVWLYTADDFNRPPRILEHYNVINLTFSLDGDWLASISDPGAVGGKIVVWDVLSSQHIDFQSGFYLLNIEFSPDKNRMLALSDRVLRIWDSITQEEIVTLPDVCSYELDTKTAVVALGGCGIPALTLLYNIATGEEVFIGEYDNSIVDVDINSNLQLVAISESYGGTITILSTDQGNPELILDSSEYYPDYPPRIEFSPDSLVLASWNTTGDTIHLWSVESGSVIAALTGHSIPGYESAGTDLGTAFSPDGLLLASFCPDGLTEDRNLRLWDTTTGALLRTLPDEFSATFSPGGAMLATDSGDGSIKIWAVSSEG